MAPSRTTAIDALGAPVVFSTSATAASIFSRIGAGSDSAYVLWASVNSTTAMGTVILMSLDYRRSGCSGDGLHSVSPSHLRSVKPVAHRRFPRESPRAAVADGRHARPLAAPARPRSAAAGAHHPR